MTITEQQLVFILPKSQPVAAKFISVLNNAMESYQITGLLRAAAFIAQIGHESNQLTQLVENLNYSAKGLAATWPKRFPPALASKYAHQPEQIANIAYNGRMGNTEPGNGWRFRGRGLIQITGKNNYRATGEALGLDLIENPELLESPEHAAMSAAWFWANNGLNELADTDQFTKITQIINGGLSGLADREILWGRAQKVMQ